MAKYYIQSGTLKAIVAAEDTQRAALWAVHRVMQQIVPIYDDSDLTPELKNEVVLLEGMLVLGDEISISEKGFERTDAQNFSTFDTLAQWHQLMAALNRLANLLLPGNESI
jgi:hypothetical protein